MAFLFLKGFESNKPSTSLNKIKVSASVICPTLAASLSLSPNFSSSVAMESFSFMTGITPESNNVLIVSLIFKFFLLSSVSENVNNICATFRFFF